MSKRTWAAIALILVAVAVAGGFLYQRAAALARVDANQLVCQAMTRAGDGSYIAQVTTVTSDGSKTATVFRQGKTEKIEYPGKSAWSMTTNGKSYTYLPKCNQLLVSEASSLLSDKDRTALLLANYRAKCVGMGAIAGRSAYVIALTSRHSSRPAKKLWIDGENYTILRTEDYSASGQLRGRTEMDHISFGARINPTTFALPTGKSVEPVTICQSCASSEFKGLGFTVAAPRYLPAGYKPEGCHMLHSTCGCGHVSAQFTYTDGLNVISVFETPRTACCKDCGMTKCDDQNCGIVTLGQVTRGDKTVVVVGDLLPKDLRKIAESVQ